MRTEIANSFNGPLIVHTTPSGTVALTVSSGHPDDGRTVATVYLDGHQVSELVTALVEARIHLADLRAMALPSVLPRANELGAVES